MDIDLSTPQFTVCQETASFVVSSGFLEESWNGIRSLHTENKGTFSLKRYDGAVYVCFSSLYMEVKDGRHEECNIQNADMVFSPNLKGNDDKPALVHKGAFNRFQYILENTDLEAQVKALREQAIIFVGHSIGGAVATLATLWFLGKGVRSASPFCITFGSPLVGDARLGEAIARQDWSGRSCHVVSQHDIVPRMLLAPFESIAEPLNAIVPHWKAGSDLPIQEASRTLVNNVLQYTASPGSRYRPSGSYMFCSTHGAACIDDSEAVLKMLHYTMQSNQGLPSDQIASACILEHTGYGKLLEDLTEYIHNARQIANVVSDDSFELGIALVLEAIGIGAQNHDALTALREAGKVQSEQDTNIAELNFTLSKNQSNMAMFEWYKLSCKRNGRGYYDCFKEKERRDFDADMLRIKLASFWDGIVEKVERHELPSDFQCQNKWINAGNAYRKLAEPLDIAEHYRQGRSENYLSVRPRRHEVLEKWLNEKNQTRSGRAKGPRTNFASLTEDSCFWAHVEEALKTLQHQVMDAPHTESLQNFESYVWKMIEDRNISDEVFLDGSSFMKWWQQYRDLPHQSQQLQSTTALFNFMSTEGWKAMAI